MNTKQSYVAPETELVSVNLEQGVIMASFEGGSIDNGSLENWGDL